VDGRTWINKQLYLIQAKRYSGSIKAEHIREFREIIHREGAAGGFFLRTGRTGPLSKQLLQDSQVKLISGQRLVDFILSEKLKIVGVTIAVMPD